MLIPSRVEVLSWNENQVADLLREVSVTSGIPGLHIRVMLSLAVFECVYFLPSLPFVILFLTLNTTTFGSLVQIVFVLSCTF